MAWAEHPRTQETITVTGTGAIKTGTTTPAGFFYFSQVCTVGDTFPLWIVDTTTTPATVEYSIGTYTAANTITRTATGGKALVNFAGNACQVFIEKLPSTLTSAGAASAGLVPALTTSGLLSQSMISLVGPVPSGVPYMFWPPVGAGASNNNSFLLSNIYRQTVLWPFPTAPAYLGAYIDTTSSGGNFAVRVYESLSDGTAGALIIDTGPISTTNGGNALNAVTALLNMPPGAYVFDFLIDSAGASAGFRGGQRFFGVFFAGALCPCDQGQCVQVLDGFLYGSFGAAPNPCSYNSSAFSGISGIGSASTISAPAFVVQF